MCCDTTMWSAQSESSRIAFSALGVASQCVNTRSPLGDLRRRGVAWGR
jgi:hypothetical protein